MRVPVLPAARLSELGALHPLLVTSTPLWYQALEEAEIFAQGLRLVPMGGRIVAEVFIGLLLSDPDAYVNAQPDFTPSLGATPGQFAMVDLLTFAGVRGRR